MSSETAKIHPFRAKMSQILVTGGGLGYFPTMPGTWGSLGGLALAYLFHTYPPFIRGFLLVLLYCAGVMAILDYTDRKGRSIEKGFDRSEIVIDEIVGQWIACLALQTEINSLTSALPWILSFVFFRTFDILKIGPIRSIDRWSKGVTGFKAASGVILDDVLAGVFAFSLLKFSFWIIYGANHFIIF